MPRSEDSENPGPPSRLDPSPSAPGPSDGEEPLERIARRAGALDAEIVLAEGEDPRLVRAAGRALEARLCRPLLLGRPSTVERLVLEAGLEVPPPVLDPATAEPTQAMERALLRRARARGRETDPAEVRQRLRQLVRDPLHHACLRVAAGLSDGAVMGAVATTAETLRAALTCIGPRPGLEVVSSCFLMALPKGMPQDGRALIYSDCGVVPDPDPEQLADIAEAAAASCRALLDEEPRVALLSFSTLGSAEHPVVEKVRRAVEVLRRRGVDFAFDGELQADAALVGEVARRKAPGSRVAGRANVLVFPDLNAGNISYKLTERLAGARAVGPLLQGLAGAVNDLSRGCSSEDVLDVMAVTALASGDSRREIGLQEDRR